MYIPKTVLRLFALAVLFVSFAGYSFIKADWTAPTATAPDGNVDTPINTSTQNQIKNGSVSLNGLALTSDYPTIAFVDPRSGHRTLYMQNHSNTFNLLGDRNGDGNVIWADDQPAALSTFLGKTPNQDYTYISNQVRSSQYCDQNGQNCTTPGATPSGARFGGAFINMTGSLGYYGASACPKPNPVTRNCNCPSGFDQFVLSSSEEQHYGPEHSGGNYINSTYTNTVICIDPS